MFLRSTEIVVDRYAEWYDAVVILPGDYRIWSFTTRQNLLPKQPVLFVRFIRYRDVRK